MIRRSLRRLLAHRSVLLRVALIVVAVVTVISVAAAWFTESLWFEAMGRSDVFSEILGSRLLLGAIAGIVVAASLASTVLIARRLTPAARAFTLPAQALEQSRKLFSRAVRRAPWIVAIGGGFAAGLSASGSWRTFLLWRNGRDFGATDPVLGRDLGDYVFGLPWWRTVQGFVGMTVLWMLIVAVLAHYLYGGIRPQRRGDRITRSAVRHLSVLGAAYAIVLAWGACLDRLDLVVGGRGVVSGAGYTDIHAGLPMLHAFRIVLALAAIALLVNAWRPRRALLTSTLLTAAVLSIAATLVPSLMQRFIVGPDEAARERPYLERSIAATRSAYGLDDVGEREFTPDGGSGLARSASEIAKLPIWSPQVLQQVAGSIQRFTPYYAFPSRADTDRYEIDGELRQVLIATREVSTRGLSGTARTWPNAHLFYTHGDGAVIAYADRSAGGLPSLLLGDLPPRATDPVAALDERNVAIGENGELGFVIDEASSGVPLDGIVRRAAFAWRLGDLNLLISGAVEDGARLLYRRDVLDRVARVVPFLTLEQDPYPAVVDGRIVWIVDGYTTSSQLPYSIPTDLAAATHGRVQGHANYIRDAVKIIVDAAEGTVDVYATEGEDPILDAWRATFPDLIRSSSELPPAIAEHLRFPQGLFEIITERYATVHVSDPATFYQQSEAWQIARDPVVCLNDPRGCARPAVAGRYLMATLGERTASFALTRPFTPIGQGRANLVGYVAADATTGKLISFTLPANAEILGPEQAQATINQDPSVSQQVSLWNQQHSKVIYGDLIGLPVNGSFVYVQALYLQAEGSDLPQLKRVVLVADGRVAMASDAVSALAQLTGGARSIFDQIAEARAQAATCVANGDDPCALVALTRLEQLLERARS